jgi:hypothetical protein
MKIDIYTKVVMTVIAVSLVKIAFTDVSIVNPAFARSGVQKIAICDDRGSYCVGVRSSGLRIEPN